MRDAVMLTLSSQDRSYLAGAQGEAGAFAMGMIVKAAEMTGARHLTDITCAYVNTCFVGSEATVDLLEWLAGKGARVAVPTQTNVGLYDAGNASVRIGDDATGVAQKTMRLMHLHKEIGCGLSMTCAPYQLPGRPGKGEQIACSESNAVAFFNSVLGARTNKYGDYLDISAALTGRVPHYGLHTDAARAGDVRVVLEDIPERFLTQDICYQLLGHALGQEVDWAVPVLEGVPRTVREDHLRSLGAAAAASGAVGLFHVLGVTPEAATIGEAFQGREPERTVTIGRKRLARALAELNQVATDDINAVALGTPHCSIEELGEIADVLGSRRIHENLMFYITMSRFTRELGLHKGWIQALESAGARILVDTCLYYAPVATGLRGNVMTNSAKWAYYAPGLLAVESVFGTLEECAESAVRGEVWRDDRLWRNETWGART